MRAPLVFPCGSHPIPSHPDPLPLIPCHRPHSAVSVAGAFEAQDFVEEQRALLDLIDKLEFAQLKGVRLPRIVVVGDQSAGKSSVLEAITGTPFLKDAGACTRFATEIRMRRSKENKFSVRIIADQLRPFPELERLEKFGGTVSESTSFETLMRDAVELIAPKNIPGRFATNDILVVEKSGPDMPLLTLVDLPGLVSNPNNDQSEEDLAAIEALTDKYIKSSRTIILAVVGGNQDYAQAKILKKARRFDPTGSRSIGVLTKPDLTASIGLEDKFIGLVNNQDKHNHFKLGWYVLLNPGPPEEGEAWPSAEDRTQRERAFFSQGKWSTLPASMCGVGPLKQKLSVQLQKHIGKHIGALEKQIEQAEDECKAELKSLGAGKDTVEEMKAEMVELWHKSNGLMIPAMDGTYKSPSGISFFPAGVDGKGTPPQNLRARAVEENEKFEERIRTMGHKLSFSSDSEPYSTNVVRIGNMSKTQYAREVVEQLLKQKRGTEFPGDHNPRLVYILFQLYSENWYKLSREHTRKLGKICNEFLAEVINTVWLPRMHDALRAEYLHTQMNSMMEKATKEIELLHQDRHFEVQPYDSEYERRIKKWREETLIKGPYTVPEELLEKMLIYYEVSTL
jgi:GTP-binding protein EngB required for normal cell division